MAQIEHSTEVDDLGKQYLPEGYVPSKKFKGHGVDRLATDRGKEAKTKISDPEKWKDRTNTADMPGFDTKQTKEKKSRKILYDMGVGYIEQEADRFADYLAGETKSIMDYETFKQTVDKVFEKDLPGFYSPKRVIKESDYKALFDTQKVQSWLNENVKEIALPIIMRQKNIERKRAEQLWERLPARKRGKVLSNILKGQKIKIRTGRIKPELQAGMVKLRRMRVKRGNKTYLKARHQPWTDIQETFIKNNRAKLTTKSMFELYNRIFSEPRTIGSIQNKRYRLK